MKVFAVPALGILSFLLTTHAWACAGGNEWTSDAGMYTTDVTDDNPFIDPKMTIHFDFALINKSDPAYGPDDTIDYSTTHVALMHGNETVFTKDIPADTYRELAGFDYQFPDKNANYTLQIHYIKNNKELAATTVPLTVGTGDPTLFTWQNGIYALIGLVIITVVGLFSGKIRPLNKLISVKFS